ncbi:mediator of RNA polymerase II transcription subunit 8 family protein [Motilibacter deserti]|uniref:YtxH domain-containing protein n=1 Tax=Motilibacter deserti TaxID=2714956 RepID=UPI0018C8854E|nr:YtxH domain-containing protein [Motilibacter deserti]
MRKLTFLAGFAAGYVAGAQAGRERYEQIKSLALRTANDPRVKETADKVQHQAADLAGTAKEQAASVAGTAKEKVQHKMEERRSDSDASASTGTDSYGTTAEDSVYVVDINDRAGVGTGSGPTGTNDRMGL